MYRSTTLTVVINSPSGFYSEPGNSQEQKLLTNGMSIQSNIKTIKLIVYILNPKINTAQL